MVALLLDTFCRSAFEGDQTMNYVFAGLILFVWFILQTGLQWNMEYKPSVNFTYSVMTFLILMTVYWVPFWLIFVK